MGLFMFGFCKWVFSFSLDLLLFMALKQNLKVGSKSIVIYRTRANTKATAKQIDALKQSWGSVEYRGFISRGTRSKIITMLNVWADSIYAHNIGACSVNNERSRKLVFLTLTLPEQQKLVDNEVKRRALMPFIQELKQMFFVSHYFWRAEAQKNGNIHFHLVIDQFIDKSTVNFLWDKHLWLSGLCSVAPVFVDKYHTATTRIEGIQGVASVAGYVCKYVTKSDGGRKIFGRIWGCSDSLRELLIPVQEFTNEVAADYELVKSIAKPEIMDNGKFIVAKVDVLRDCRLRDTLLFAFTHCILLTNYTNLYQHTNLQWMRE